MIEQPSACTSSGIQSSCDVIIIGGGPAGAAAGLALRTRGIDCWLLEKSQAGRAKLCGGLLTQKTMDFIAAKMPFIALEKLYSKTANHIKMYYRSILTLQFRTAIPYYFTERSRFDHELLTAFQTRGGCIQYGERATAVDPAANCLQTQSGKSWKFKFLIDCSGVHSVIRRPVLAPKYRVQGFALQVNAAGSCGDAVEIFYGLLPLGYGWIFPKDGYVTVGAGGQGATAAQCRKALEHICAHRGLNLTNQRIHGAFLPFGEPCPRYTAKNTAIAGDAAGLADPFTGEGIYFALRSGWEAGLAAAACLENQASVFSPDAFSDTESCRRLMADGLWLRKRFYSPHALPALMQLARGHNGGARFFCDNAIARCNYGYRELFTMILTYLKRRRQLNSGPGALEN